MKPLQRARRSLRTAREGTSRTVRWFGGGIASGPRRLVDAIGREDGQGAGSARGTGADATAARRPQASQGETGPGPFARIRGRGRSATLSVAGGLLLAAWIAWTAYVWTENGASAGLGVLISWPAMLAAAALISSPLWATWLLMRERRAGGAGPAGADDRDRGAAERSDGGGEASADHA